MPRLTGPIVLVSGCDTENSNVPGYERIIESPNVLPPGTEFDKLLRVQIMVTMFSAAYIAEVVRGGLAAIPRGQYEAADAFNAMLGDMLAG